MCRSTAGPPVLAASPMSADQSGREMTRLKWPPRSLPYLPPRTASAAKANSGTNGNTWATISSRPASAAVAQHEVGLLRRQGDGLFDQDVLARPQGRDRHFGVQVRRRTDVNQIDVGVGEQLLVARVALHVGQVHHLAGRAEVAADAAPVAGQLLGVAAATGPSPGRRGPSAPPGSGSCP